MKISPTLILVVDDYADALVSTARILATAGYQVAQAANGTQALLMIRELRPALVLLDVVLPDLSGLEVLRQVRADATLAGISIVLLSGQRIDAVNQAAGLEGGADGYIARPVATSELLARVRLHLRQRELIEQLQASEQAAVEQAAMLRIAGRTARLGGWMIQLPDRTLTWSDETAAIHDLPPGYTPTLEEGISYYLPEHRELVRSQVEACSALGTAYDFELPKITATGRRIWVRSIGEAVRDASGRITRLQGAFQDVTESHRTKVALHESAETLREQASLLDLAQDAIMVRDLDQRILYWNRSAERLYGWPAAEVIGRSVSDLLHRDPAFFQAAVAATLAHGEWSGELEQTTRQGETLSVEGRWTLVRDAEGRPKSILSINTDITQRKQLERQYLRAQRMESIGTLAGGIAHDLNNVLAPILMSIELLQTDEADSDRRAVLSTIEGSARRGAAMVQQVLSFARGMEGRRVDVHLQHIVGDLGRIARDTFPKNIQIAERLSPDLWAIQADPTQIQQVLLNLYVNARDAMPAGGRITIAAENLLVDEPYAARNIEARVGPHVVITIEDTGTGIPAELLDKIFDPFFTTKDVGKGTGLGLATSLAIVKSHGGFIRVENGVEVGARFRLYLPAQVGAAAAAAADPQAQLPRGNGELVLVVDDEAPIREITRQTLERFGYRVMLATDGTEAVALYARHRDAISLIITDMMMPVMDGAATIQALRRINPRLRIIGASGLSPDGVTPASVASALADEATVGIGAAHFLPKPYSAATLLQAVRAALDA